MKKIEIPKKNGEKRLIYSCTKRETAELRKILDKINQNDLQHAYGFIKGKNIVSAARKHIGYKVTISVDIKDFFDNVKKQHVKDKLPSMMPKVDELGFFTTIDIFDKVFVDGAPRQGLATSPAIANISGKRVDDSIVRAIKKLALDGKTAYIRYADDIVVSLETDDKETIQIVLRKMKNCISRCGFKVNDKKTRIQYSKYGRRQILGIMVDEDNVYISRNMRRRMRSAVFKCFQNPTSKHFHNKAQGLVEFSKLKTPVSFGERLLNINKHVKKKQILEFNNIAKNSKRFNGWSLKEYPVKSIQNEDLGENCYVTTDPVYMAGMSYFTTGWTSCMNIGKAGGNYSNGVKAWIMLEGCSIAFSIADQSNTKKLYGVERVCMNERALVFKNIHGQKGFARIYSGVGNFYYNENSCPPVESVLVRSLLANGYLPAQPGDSSEKWISSQIEGYLPCHANWPYADAGRIRNISINDEIRNLHPKWPKGESQCGVYVL